jgi:hypothetical protein
VSTVEQDIAEIDRVVQEIDRRIATYDLDALATITACYWPGLRAALLRIRERATA